MMQTKEEDDDLTRMRVCFIYDNLNICLLVLTFFFFFKYLLFYAING